MTRQTLKKLGNLSVDDYVNIVREVWRNIHNRRTVFDYALHVLDHASKLGEVIRRDDANLILKEMAETANWLFGFVAKLNDKKTGWEKVQNIPIKFSHMIWNKYPNLCPHCFQRVYILNWREKAGEDIAKDIRYRCKYCLPDYPRVEERSTEQEHEAKKALREYAQKTVSSMPKTLQKMEEMFHTIYEANTSISTLESIGFHLLEEAGEMGRAVIDIYTSKSADRPLEEKRIALCDEVAEVFAWICSLTLKVRMGAKTFDKYRNRIVSYTLPSYSERNLADYIGLEEILWVIYRKTDTMEYHCPYCHETPCRCELEFAWERVK